jgi:rfaE bifunctional protein kinase chain/domain
MPGTVRVPDFARLRVAVVGDLIADHYVYARPGRLSREAPVMVLRHVSERVDAGGAANVARNLWALGARVQLFGTIGPDEVGEQLLGILSADAIDTSGVLRVPSWTTPRKTRVLAAEPRRTMQQVVRIDRDTVAAPDPEARAALRDKLRSLAGAVDALLVSDYHYGLVETDLAEVVRELQDAGALVVLDPRRNLNVFRRPTAITPNLSELARGVGRPEEDLEEPERVVEAAHEVLERVGPRWLLVTMGNRGMALFGAELPHGGLSVEASGSAEVVDVSGAGDTAAAAFTVALAAGVDGPSAMRLANAAAGVVVMENGTAVCSSSRLRAALAEAPEPVEFGSATA